MSRQEVAIFWDYEENCPSPTGWSGYEVVKRIRYLAQEFGPVKLLKAYLSISEQSSQPSKATLRSELQASGVSLTDTPHNGRKEVADKMIIVDMLTHAMDNPAPATILLISGDRDYAYAISVLRLRQYDVVLVTHANAHSSLTSQASVCFDWATDILGTLGTAEPTASALNRPSSSSESVAGPNDFKFPSLKFVPVPKSPTKASYSTSSPLKPAGKDAFSYNAKESNGVEGLSLRSPIQPNFDVLHLNPSSGINLRPPSPTEDLFSGFHRTPSRPPNTQDPFTTAFRSYPSPQLSSLSMSTGPPDTPTSFQDSTFRISRPSTPVTLQRPQSVVAEGAKSPSRASISGRSTTSSYASASEELPPKLNKPALMPSHFKPLVKLLQEHHRRGEPRPFRPGIASELVSADKSVYESLPGINTFAQYAQLAQKSGIVDMAELWIMLKPEYLDADVS
ncbi:hypothetical protein H1R20_g7892, partial [Candolleomyces eurysporus]